MFSFFKLWTARHYLNFGIFLLGAVAAVGITAGTTWYQLPSLFTPATTIGFLISTLGFLLQTATGEPRDPMLGTRSTDPEDTERVRKLGPVTLPVPPVTPGRPVEPKEP